MADPSSPSCHPISLSSYTALVLCLFESTLPTCTTEPCFIFKNLPGYQLPWMFPDNLNFKSASKVYQQSPSEIIYPYRPPSYSTKFRMLYWSIDWTYNSSTKSSSLVCHIKRFATCLPTRCSDQLQRLVNMTRQPHNKLIEALRLHNCHPIQPNAHNIALQGVVLHVHEHIMLS